MFPIAQMLKTDFNLILSQEQSLKDQKTDSDLDICSPMSDFISELEEEVYNEDMLFLYQYLTDQDGKPIQENHQVYKVAVDFIEELKNPIPIETSTHCFNHMQSIIKVIYDLVEYQDDVPDDVQIENWRNIMIQTLLIAKTYYNFFKDERNA